MTVNLAHEALTLEGRLGAKPPLIVPGVLVLVRLGGRGEDVIAHLGTERVHLLPLIFARRRIAGSLIGGLAETQEMLDFCGRHRIVSDIELIDMAYINDAYARIQRKDVKHRFVIDLATLADQAA